MIRKTHFGTVEVATESYNHDEWSDTLCGLKEAEIKMSNNIKFVDCKKCIKSYDKYKESEKRTLAKRILNF